MEYSEIEVVNVLFSTIANGSLMSDVKKPNGKLCKFERPLNSVFEDVVVNSVGVVYNDVQEGVLNVNVYVPNLKFPDNPEDKNQPDTARLLYLSKLGKIALGRGNEMWDEDGNWCFELQQDKVYPDENFQHYINFRVEFNSTN